MSKMKLYGHVLAATLLASMAAPVAHAANECRIVYGYHTPSMSGPVRHQVEVDLNAGQLSTPNISRLDFVRSKNSSAHRVRVKLEGALQNEFTLNNGDRNPISVAGFYATPTTLQELRCTTEIVPAALGSPAQLISTLNAVNQTSAQIAQALKTHFNLGAAEIANLLINAGFPLNEVTQTLRNALGVTAAEAINILHATGSSMQQVATTVRTAFNATTADMVSGFLQFWASVDSLQCTATSCPPMLATRLAELRTALATPPQDFANAVAAGLRTHFQVDAERCAALLDAIGQISREMAQIAMIAAGYLADQVTAALNFVYGTGTLIVAQTTTFITGTASSAVEAGQTASADSLNLVYIVHGEYRQCTSPSGRDIYGLINPLPLPPNNQVTTITLGFQGPQIGRGSFNASAPGIATVSSLTGFPSGVNAMIREKGTCFIIVDVLVPGSTPSGATGKANVMVGSQSGPSFDWTIGNIPSPAPGKGYDYAASPVASARNPAQPPAPGGRAGGPAHAPSMGGPVPQFPQAGAICVSLDGPYAASDYPEVEFRWGADVQTAQSVTALGGQWTHHYEIRSWPRNGVACPATTIGPIFNNNGCVWSSDRAISGENSTSHTLAAGTEYLWQVRSVIAPAGTGWPSGKADATVGAWSAARSFTSAPRLHPPELESPANGELFSASVVELKWRRNACPVDSYEFAFSIAAWPLDGPDPTRLPESSSSHTIAVVTNSDYHWRMRSRKSGMDPSPWSPTRYFKVKQKGK